MDFGSSAMAVSVVNTLRGVELDGRHVMLQHMQSMCVVLLWIMAYAAKVMLAFMPGRVPVPVLTKALQSLTTLPQKCETLEPVASRTIVEASHNHVVMASKTPIGRALTQVLALMNDVPSSSNKYAFLQDLADRAIEENRADGVKFNSVNQAVLRRGFTRTINLLGQSLQSRQPHHSFLAWLRSHLCSGSMFSSILLAKPVSVARSVIGNVLSPLTLRIPNSNSFIHRPKTDLADAEMAEKFARELLWITEKLLACGGMEEAVKEWSSSPSLAHLSLDASPKVQKSLVRLSALLCKGLVDNSTVPQEEGIQLLLLWLPLLCNATHGGDGPIFNSVEKGDAERHLERLVAALPEAEQEQILSSWLHEYALSQSDWPNLQNSYNSWCHSMRKLSPVTMGNTQSLAGLNGYL